MELREIMPGFYDPAPCVVCEKIEGISRSRSPSELYRVPLHHRRLSCCLTEEAESWAGRAALAELPDMACTRQLRALYESEEGLGLWAPVSYMNREDLRHAAAIASMGSVLIPPPHEWEVARSMLRDSLDRSPEYKEVRYLREVDDLLPFAISYSSSYWILVLRGQLAGSIMRWEPFGHNELKEPWATDIAAWAKRLFAECPGVFGGIPDLRGSDSIDPCDANAPLWALRYCADMYSMAK
jgi:hypothetical protein